MYLIKTKGSSNIPEYIQLRNNDFVLISHFRTDKANSSIIKHGLEDHKNEILEIINRLPYGILYKIN
jgi:hypothetical protein